MAVLFETPYKLSLAEKLESVAITLLLRSLIREGVRGTTLREVCTDPQYGFTASASLEPLAYRLLRITDIRAGRVDWDTVPYCSCDRGSTYLLKAGDILIARSGSVGKSFLIDKAPYKAVFASYMIRLQAKPGVSPNYLYWCLQSQLLWEQIAAGKRGSAMKNINGTMIGNLRFPVPSAGLQESIVKFMYSFRSRLRGESIELTAMPSPLSEQPQIVARIEELAGKIEEVRGLRKEAVEFCGQLIERKRAQIFEHLISSDKVRLDDAALLERGKFSHRPRNEPRFFGGRHPWIQIAEIEGSGKYIQSWTQTLNDEGLAISKKFPRGTVLVSIAATIGAVGILEFDCCVPDSVVGVTPKKANDSEFIYHYLCYVRGHLESIAPQSAQKNINLQILSLLPFPVVKSSEQRRIVAYLDDLQSKVDALKKLQAETSAELDALLPSILDKAFKGEL